MGKHNVTLKKRGGAAVEKVDTLKFSDVGKFIQKNIPNIDIVEYIKYINTIDRSYINTTWINTILNPSEKNIYIKCIPNKEFNLIVTCIYIVINIDSYNYEPYVLRKLLTLKSNNKNINIEYMLGDINKEITDFIDVIDYKPDKESIFKNYITLLYEYNNLNDYNNIILLYCSYTLIINYITDDTKPQFVVSSSMSDSKRLSESDIKIFLNKQILKKEISGESILDIMNTNINTVLQKFHNELIYRFSPYNIINQYLSDTKINNKYFNDNITILKICILLYSTKYTKLQQQIININMDGNIFTQFKDNTTYATIIKDINKPQPVITSDIYNTNNIEFLQEFIKKIEEYLNKYIYGKGLLGKGMIIKTYKKYFSELYNTLELTIKKIYTPVAPAGASGRGKPSYSVRGRGNSLNRPVESVEVTAPVSPAGAPGETTDQSLSIIRPVESVAPSRSRPPVRGRGKPSYRDRGISLNRPVESAEVAPAGASKSLIQKAINFMKPKII